MKVYIPTPLRSYTEQTDEVQGKGSTVSEMLLDVDRRYPGIRFRIVNEQESLREHIRIFVNQEETNDLSAPLKAGDEVFILCALSGG